MIGRNLGNYRVIEQIGIGGMATVYKAYDPDTDRYVAIKVLPEHFSQDPKFRQRFQREAKAIAKLEHIHILPLFAYGEEEGTAYMVMRYLEAGSLTDHIRQSALPLPEASRLLSQIASALDHAHAHGVLHRDVKPSNVLLDNHGNAFLTDFGIAKMVESTLDLTGGGILGTPAYMSPEQCRGKQELTPTSDQYSLGIILYEMITGRAPFQAETPIALIHMQLNEPLPLPRQVLPDLPEEAERVILKALTKDPPLRYPTCGEMAASFARVVAETGVTAPPVDDLTMASPAPAAVTAPGADEATVLHDTAEQLAVKPRPRRRVPAWVFGLIGVLVVGLIGAAIVAALFLFSEEEGTPVTGAETEREVTQTEGEVTGTEKEGGESEGEVTEVEEGGKFWDFEGGDTQGWSVDSEGWQVVETGDGFVLEGRASEEKALDRPPFAAYPPDLSGYDNFSLSFRLKSTTGGVAELFFREQSGRSGCYFYDLMLSPQNLEIWKQAGPCRPPDRVLAEAPTSVGYNAWHDVEVTMVGGELEVAIDGEPVINLEDVDPLPPEGGLYFGAGGPPGATFYLDDVRISRIEGPEAVAQARSGDLPPNREVRPCNWDERGPGLCIFSPSAEEPIHLLEDAELELTGAASWSPDGERIAFSAIALDGDEEGSAIYTVNADGTDLVQLPRVGNDVDPVWSPDGEWLAFHSSCDLALMRPDGSESQVTWLREEDKCVEFPQWSPDSRSIVASVLEEGEGEQTFPVQREVWVVTDEGETFIPVVTITHENEDCLISEVVFSPDGHQVAYLDADCQPQLADADGSGHTEPLDEFPYWWMGMNYPQWEEPFFEEEEPFPEEEPPPVAEPFFEDFEGETLDPLRWELEGDVDHEADFLDEGQFRIDFDNDLSRPWDLNLGAKLEIPAVRHIEFNMGLEEATGQHVGFGLGFLDESGETRNVLFNADGAVLFEERGEVIELIGPAPLPLVYNFMLKWEEANRMAVYIDDELAHEAAVPGFARSVVFWIHLEPDEAIVGYLDDVFLEYAVEEEAFEPASEPDSGEESRAKILESCGEPGSPQICVRYIPPNQITPLTEDLDFGAIFRMAWSPDGERIVFDAGSDPEVGPGDDHKLYLINADGAELEQITTGDTNDALPTWSPDGEWIAFHRDCGLWVIHPDGSEVRMLFETDEFCVGPMGWSPDSEQIAFLNTLGNRATSGEIWVINREGAGPHAVHSFDLPAVAWAVTWSPDGQRLALWHRGEEKGPQMLLINPEGGDEPKLIERQVIDEERLWSWLPQFWPQWSE